MGNEDLSQLQNSALADSLLDSFALICRLNGVATSKDALISGLPLKEGKMTPALVQRSAERVNLVVSILKHPVQKIRPEYLPAILLLKDDEACVLKHLDHQNKVAAVVFPELGDAEVQMSLDELAERSLGYIMVAKLKYAFDKRAPSSGKVRLYDRIEERVNAGVTRRVDLEQATGRLALAESNLLTEMTNLHDVTARMVRLYGELPPETLETPTFTKAGVEATAADALKLAYYQNPDLLATIEDIQSKEREIKFNEARYMPRLDLQARKNLGTSSDGANSLASADILEITMNLNLFNGFSDQNLVKQTAEKLNNSRDLRDKVCIDTRQVVTIALNDIEQLKEQRIYRERHVVSIENAREAYRKQFDIGQRTLLDLLDTENEYFQAKRSLANTEYDIQIAHARVYAGQGELLNKIGASRGNVPEQSRGDYADAENVCMSVIPDKVTVDKEALLANAKPLGGTLSKALTLPTPPVAQPQAAVTAAPVLACSISELTSLVDDWATAWRKKDTDKFLKFYGNKFTPEPPQPRAAWEKEKIKNISTKSKIELKLKDVQVQCNNDKATVRFNQDYRLVSFKIKKTGKNSECEVCNMKRIPIVNYSSNVNKELQLMREEGAWKIVKELVNQ